MTYYDTYRDQLASLDHGHALWEPDPAGRYDQVQVGDVGYVNEGYFLRMFNALLPADDPAQQRFRVPEGFVPLSLGPFDNIRTLTRLRGEYCSDTVRVECDDRRQAAGPEEGVGALFKCGGGNKGAFLSLPFDSDRVDAIRKKAFQTYIRKHCDSWLEFAGELGFDIRLEDIILVTGCDLTSSWAMATFLNPLNPEITLRVRPSQDGSATFQWAMTSQRHNNEQNQNVFRSHCVFLRGFRAKRILPFYKTLKGAAGPRPDNPDNDPESQIELLPVPAESGYRDPLIGILDYIAKKCPDQEIAIAHENDLKMIGGADVLTADAVERFLDQNGFPVKTENGVALLAGEDEEVPEEEKMIFYARAALNLDGEPIPFVIHPVLGKGLLKFDLVSQPLDYDFGLPAEEFFSPAVHPPVQILFLENDQGLPPNIKVQASAKGSGIGVTVEDVLQRIGVDLRRSPSQRESTTLDEEYVRLVFRGRNRLQVLPKHPFPEDDDGNARPLPLNRVPTFSNSIARIRRFIYRSMFKVYNFIFHYYTYYFRFFYFFFLYLFSWVYERLVQLYRRFTGGGT